MFLLLLLPSAASGSGPDLPPLMLWAWERPEDFSFLDPGKAGVAFLMATVRISDAGTRVRPRLQPLVVPPETPLEAVVRIESDAAGPGPFSATRCTELASSIVSLALRLGVRRLQIDFDARLSERAGYRRLLIELRRLWAPPRTLSMTALASWCLGDAWIAGLPVDWAVPMFFRMGPDRPAVARYLSRGRPLNAAPARSSWGISTDELDFRPPPGRRLYVFHPRPWDREAFEELSRWLDR